MPSRSSSVSAAEQQSHLGFGRLVQRQHELDQGDSRMQLSGLEVLEF